MNNKKGYIMNTPKQLDLFNDNNIETVSIGTSLKGYFHIACMVLTNPANKKNGVNNKVFKNIMHLCDKIQAQGIDVKKLGFIQD